MGIGNRMWRPHVLLDRAGPAVLGPECPGLAVGGTRPLACRMPALGAGFRPRIDRSLHSPFCLPSTLCPPPLLPPPPNRVSLFLGEMLSR